MPFPRRELGPIYITMSPGPRSTSVPSGILIRGPEIGGAVPLFLGGVGSHVSRSIPRIKWHLGPCSRWATIHGPKLGVLYPHFWGVPSDTMSPEPRYISVPSGILIHPAVCRQHTWAEKWGFVPLFGRGSWVPI